MFKHVKSKALAIRASDSNNTIEANPRDVLKIILYLAMQCSNYKV